MIADWDAPVAWVTWTLVGLVGTAGIVSLGAGSTVYFGTVQSWIGRDFVFEGFGLIDWFLGLLGAAAILGGLVLLGFLCRLLPWRHAPRASLCLAIAAVIFVTTTLLIFSQTDIFGAMGLVLFPATGLIALLITALPPFLHWRMAARAGIAASPQPGATRGAP